MTTYCGHSHRTRFREIPVKEQIVKRVPTQDEIAKLAYSYWEQRGRRHGAAMEDWLRAERELHEKFRLMYRPY
jgi:hypothetical protein